MDLFSFISIHLMLLFNTFKTRLCKSYKIISIHLMLLFNDFIFCGCKFSDSISIHLMLLFNLPLLSAVLLYYHFNTSNVTIQLTRRTKDLKQLFDFNTSNVTIQLLRWIKVCQRINFNTSNVTIQPTILSHLFYSQFHYTHYISTFS